jgi:hypothetical protein
MDIKNNFSITNRTNNNINKQPCSKKISANTIILNKCSSNAICDCSTKNSCNCSSEPNLDNPPIFNNNPIVNNPPIFNNHPIVNNHPILSETPVNSSCECTSTTETSYEYSTCKLSNDSATSIDYSSYIESTKSNNYSSYMDSSDCSTNNSSTNESSSNYSSSSSTNESSSNYPSNSSNYTTSTESNSCPSSKSCDCDNLDEKLLEIVNNVDTQMNQNIDFIQQQLNMISTSYLEVIKELHIDNNRYSTLINEINNITEEINDFKMPLLNTGTEHDNCECCKMIYTDTTQIHKYVIKNDIKFIYLTMVGGGGAGGIGFIQNMYYYSGGGGGSGACVINKPICVEIGTIIKIKVGKGSDARFDLCGENTYVEILYPNLTKITVCASGGRNGRPSSIEDPNVDGGCGGKSYLCMLKGCRGKDGTISLPSYTSANGGDGGSSIFYKGGDGGCSYFSDGGLGGTVTNLLGENGKFGSGGGGSCPKSNIDRTNRISGLGGDGVVIIEC